MGRIQSRALAGVVAVGTVLAAASTCMPLRVVAHGQTEEQQRIETAAKLKASSVLVRSGQSHGTGFVVGEERWIVTNAHVVRECRCRRVVVETSGGCRFRARVLVYRPERDLAVVVTDARLDTPPLPLAETGDVRVGQTVLAYGHPFELVGTLTQGIVSAIRAWKGIPKVIQTDAAINPGNSGGPLADLAGRVVGVNSSIFPGMRVNHGIGFAIPAGYVRELLEEAREGHERRIRERAAAACRGAS